MNKEKVVYRFFRYNGNTLHARKEIPFEFKLKAQLVLDELCFKWNKEQLVRKLNHAIDTNNKEEFRQLSKEYNDYIWE